MGELPGSGDVLVQRARAEAAERALAALEEETHTGAALDAMRAERDTLDKQWQAVLAERVHICQLLGVDFTCEEPETCEQVIERMKRESNEWKARAEKNAAIVKAAKAETEAEDAVTALDEKVHVRGAPFTEYCNLVDAEMVAHKARRKAVRGEG